ncbi:MAG: DUF1559 domain-containing protein [Isosphaeraceae bacterium]|nr:DUF1559 domain-containing protein [Isosphaeraceae bacterium]
MANSTRSEYSRGFTLIELLVVISIIALLVGLLLPAVQRSREAARQATCRNNLKQIGLALAHYADAKGGFPPGYVSSWTNQGNDTGPGWGWGAMILPFLEQQPLFDAISFTTQIQDPSQQTARMTSLKVFLCPSDTMSPSWTTSSGETWMYDGQTYSVTDPICDLASANYVGMFGIGEPGVGGNGVFSRDSFVAYRDITDGTSNTFAVGERCRAINNGRGQATWVGAVTGADFYSCTPNPNDPDGGICVHEAGSGMVLGHTGEGHGPGDIRGDVNQFLSSHGFGCLFLFCDGHVSWAGGGINYQNYLALSTYAGGELISQSY